MPASATVPAGSTTVTFNVDANSIGNSTSVTISATYAGVTRTSTLAVTITPPRASFTVSGSSAGAGACVLVEDGRQMDCRLDASASQGQLVTWIWRYFTQASDGDIRGAEETRRDAVWGRAELISGCGLVDGARTSTDAAGRRYIELRISLEVIDRENTRSVSDQVLVPLYPNNRCGY